MKNITVSVDDEIYHAARVEAARRRKSLSALVREFLSRMRKGAAPGEPNLDAELAMLLRSPEGSQKKAKGRRSATDAAKAERLLKALRKARNTEPVPRLRREELYDRKALR